MEDFGFSEKDEYVLNAIYQEDGSYRVTFSIEKKMATKIMKEYYKARKKLFKVNGFRKGKAPPTLVEKMMGGKKGMYGPTFSTYANVKVMQKAPYKVNHTYDFEVEEVESGWEVTFGAQFEAVADITDEHLVMKFDLPTLEIDDYVDYRLHAFSRLHPILCPKEPNEEGNIIAEDDNMVEVAIEAFLDGEKFEAGSEDATNLRLVKGGVKPESLYNKLLGTTTKNSFDIRIGNPDEVPSSFKEDFVGKKDLLIRVKVNHIFTCKDPELDDELAITAGYDNFKEWASSLSESAARINKGRDDQLRRTLILDHIINTIEYPDFSDQWASEKADELTSKGYENTQAVRDELKKVAKQNILLKYIGEHLGVEWDEDQQDKSRYERNEQGYAEKTLIHLIDEKVEWKYVDTKSEGDSGQDRSDGAAGQDAEGSTPPAGEALAPNVQTEV